METESPLIGPLTLFWKSGVVRTHLLGAGRELLLALQAGLAQLETESIDRGLTHQYPYLHAALQQVRHSLARWTTTTPAKAATRTKKRPRGTTRRKRGRAV